MFNIYIIDRITKNQCVIETVETEEKAESFYDSWGWIYSDEKGGNYYLDYAEI